MISHGNFKGFFQDKTREEGRGVVTFPGSSPYTGARETHTPTAATLRAPSVLREVVSRRVQGLVSGSRAVRPVRVRGRGPGEDGRFWGGVVAEGCPLVPARDETRRSGYEVRGARRLFWAGPVPPFPDSGCGDLTPLYCR